MASVALCLPTPFATDNIREVRESTVAAVQADKGGGQLFVGSPGADRLIIQFSCAFSSWETGKPYLW